MIVNRAPRRFEINSFELLQWRIPVVKAMILNHETITLKVEGNSPCSRPLLADEIKGVTTCLVTLPSGARFELASTGLQQVISFLVAGAGVFTTGVSSNAIPRLTSFAARPGTPAVFIAEEDCCLLQIRMKIDPDEMKQLDDPLFPLVRRYEDCEHYRDYFKTEKTVSRTLIPPFTLPRFSMGSVETTGPDRIDPHAHPVLDQLFFSLAENDCDLLIDGESSRFNGNCLLHIPLGSMHGIEAGPGDIVHYLWLDFFERSEDMQYIVETHKPVAA